ncbi:unnamed protein product [Paramecium octaurelia]|uniref:Transmembrane protein n=1 Tax=Paramecium octaurelia TaxID=43137 RepID=A0A8S1WLN5_PAROT|nr:unnamed protein product [Paramecium octaurelia]
MRIHKGDEYKDKKASYMISFKKGNQNLQEVVFYLKETAIEQNPKYLEQDINKKALKNFSLSNIVVTQEYHFELFKFLVFPLIYEIKQFFGDNKTLQQNTKRSKQSIHSLTVYISILIRLKCLVFPIQTELAITIYFGSNLRKKISSVLLYKSISHKLFIIIVVNPIDFISLLLQFNLFEMAQLPL